MFFFVTEMVWLHVFFQTNIFRIVLNKLNHFFNKKKYTQKQKLRKIRPHPPKCIFSYCLTDSKYNGGKPFKNSMNEIHMVHVYWFVLRIRIAVALLVCCVHSLSFFQWPWRCTCTGVVHLLMCLFGSFFLMNSEE